MGGSCAVNGALLFPRRCVCVALCLGVSFGSCCRLWLRVSHVIPVLLQLSCMVSGDSALWRGIWRRPVPSSRAGGDGSVDASCVRWGASGRRLCGWAPLNHSCLRRYMNQSTWVGKVEGGLGGASCRLMRRAVRLTRVATGGQASEHRRVLCG